MPNNPKLSNQARGAEGNNLQAEESVMLRLATQADHEFARNAFMVAYRDVMEAQYGEWDQAVQDKKFQEVWDDKESKIQIVTVGGKPSGFIQVEELPDVLWFDELVLLPEAQGKGVGSSLIRQLQEKAAQLQLPVKLNVLHANPAIALYKRLGFDEIGDTETYTEMEWKSIQDTRR